MRTVFLGTGSFALAALERLTSGPCAAELVGVVTQPDRPKGRGRKLQPGPVAVLAEASGIPVLKTPDVNDDESVEWIRARSPKAGVVVDFGQILRRAVLDLPPEGYVNVHPSLLPRHRGATPVPYTILRGDGFGGVTVQRVIRKMDAGPILGQVATPVAPDETAGDLADRLRPMGAELLVSVLDSIADGEAVATEQEESLATMAPKLGSDDRVVDWSLPAAEVSRRIRAMSPRPAVAVFLEREEGPAMRVALTRCVARDVASASGASAEGGAREPGRIVALESDAVIVACGEGEVALLALKPAGKGEMDAGAFIRGYRPEPGARFATVEPAV